MFTITSENITYSQICVFFYFRIQHFTAGICIYFTSGPSCSKGGCSVREVYSSVSYTKYLGTQSMYVK